MRISLEAGNLDNTSVTVGTQQIVLQNYFYGNFTSLPDVAAPSEWLPNGNLRMWIPVRGGSVCVEGPDISHLSYKSFALRAGPTGEFDDNYAGLTGSVLRFPDGKYYAAYHGDNGGTRTGGGVSPNFGGFWQEVGAASSVDGYTFNRIGKIISSWEPIGTLVGNGADTNANGGAQHPSLAFSRDGKYVYCYFLDYTYSIQGSIGWLTFPWSVARSKVSDLMAPGSWFKYYHPYTTQYNTNHPNFCSFSEPGLQSQPTNWTWFSANYLNVNYPTTLLSNDTGGWIMHSVRYITNSRVYLSTMIYSSNAVTGASSGLFYSLSSNGLEWVPARRITNSVVFANGFNLLYPTFVEGLDCSATNISGWIFYGYTPGMGIGHVGAVFPINISAPGPMETTPLINPAL
ncbi:MAG: hypothetical protein JNM63_16795, partial [Spirochaetia bacterium]|nr:hypothetical protein [Spirochaetia bacterium]